MQAGDLHFRLLNAGENVEAALVIGEARLGRPDAAGRPVEQADAEDVLELHHHLARRGTGGAERPRGLGETAERDHFGERVHGGELVHRLYPNGDSVRREQHIVSRETV